MGDLPLVMHKCTGSITKWILLLEHVKSKHIFADIPLDCNDAMTNHDVEENRVTLIDIDGPFGSADVNMQPFLVYCDVTSYPHVAVTEIPTTV